MTNKTANKYSNGCTLPACPLAIFKIGYAMNPNAIPVEILEVSGITSIIKNAGNASSKFDQSIWRTDAIINVPTIINTGEVIAETVEIDDTSGEKNEAAANKTATVKVVNPVRPPAATPAEDST